MPQPPVGGMPYSSARMKSASKNIASSSPASLLATCAWKRAAWSSASFNSEKPLAYSRPVMNSSKRSVIVGSASDARASGDTSTG